MSAANGYNHDAVIDKITKLTERVNVSISKLPTDLESKDLIWCKRLLSDVKESGLVPDKIEFKMANLMWKKYGSGVKLDDDVVWSLIDMLLTQETPSKIQAIKIYRRFVESTLREAKEAIDARDYGLKNGWDV